MDEFRNYNGYNSYGEQPRSEQHEQQNWYGYRSYDNMNNNTGNMNEVVYRPEKKTGRAKKVLTACAAILAAAAIGLTSIIGYKLITDDKTVSKSDDSSSVSRSAELASANKNTAEKSGQKETVKRDMPTIVQLASPDDAMKIPDIVKKVSPSVVGVSTLTSTGTATGTGIIMSEDGYIITNAHVIENAKSVSILLPDSYSDESKTDSKDLTVDAEIIGQDKQTDIAVLKINKTGLTKAEFGKSSELQAGELAIVIGNPLGFELANSVTSGIISAVNRSITVDDRVMNTIQTDAAINGGNSGGPLINAYGQVVGITSVRVSASVGDGLSFAIPIDEAIPIVKELIEHGYVTGRPTLGVGGETVSNVYAQYYDIPKGFFVRKVYADSAAEKAGIKVGDIIIGIEGKLISSLEEFNNAKNAYRAGDTVKISVYRDGEIKDFEVTLDEAVDEPSDAQEEPEEDLYRRYREYFNQFPF